MEAPTFKDPSSLKRLDNSIDTTLKFNSDLGTSPIITDSNNFVGGAHQLNTFFSSSDINSMNNGFAETSTESKLNSVIQSAEPNNCKNTTCNTESSASEGKSDNVTEISTENESHKSSEMDFYDVQDSSDLLEGPLHESSNKSLSKNTEATQAIESEWEDDHSEKEKTLEPHDIQEAEALKKKGNELFSQQKYSESLSCYMNGITFCREDSDKELLSTLYNNCSACHMGLNELDLAISASSKAIELNPSNVKAYFRRYRIYKRLKKWSNAVADMDKLFELDKSLKGQCALEYNEMSSLAKEQFEKEKDEMIGKIKDAGNWLLGKVGLSLDNFNVQQNPEGSYNISFKQNQT